MMLTKHLRWEQGFLSETKFHDSVFFDAFLKTCAVYKIKVIDKKVAFKGRHVHT